MSTTAKHNGDCPHFSSALATIAAVLSVIPLTHAAVTEAWVHRYSNVVSNTDDRAIKVAYDTAGDIIVLGTTTGGVPGNDILTIKYSGADGTVLWQKRYNGPANGDDRAKAMAVDPSGNVIITGTSVSDNNSDFYTAKYAGADGALLWERRHDGYVNALALDGSGNVVVTGAGYYTAKYAAANGAVLWERRYDGPGNADMGRAVAVDGSGNVFVTGYSRSAPNGDTDYYTAKYAAADGTVLWEKRYNAPQGDYDDARAVVVDSHGNAVVTGTSGNSVYTAKYAAADGSLLWEQRRDNTRFDEDPGLILAADGSDNVIVIESDFGDGYQATKYATLDAALLWAKHRNALPQSEFTPWAIESVAVDGGGNVIVAASSGTFFVSSYFDTAKFAAEDGTLLWAEQYDAATNSYDSAQSVAVDHNGNVAVTGISRRNEADYRNDDYLTVKYAADGARLWEQRYDGYASHYAYPNAAAADSNGNVAVTGVTFGSHDSGGWGEVDAYTAKYSAANGALLWERRHHGDGRVLAVDSSGNVVVIGDPYDGTNGGYTAKYAAADGAVLWEQRSKRFGRAVGLDREGNVFTTGSFYDGTNFDYYTTKYAAADGALLWEKRYDGPANYHDEAEALAVDSRGNVLLTGTSCTPFPTNGYVLSICDYYTVKYAGADGALLWERRYDGPINDDDRASAIALDSDDNVVVTGKSAGSGSSFGDFKYDYYTAKYAASDGTLLWEKRYNGPGNYTDEARAVAVDGAGNVVVTGRSFDGTKGIHADYYTAKYAAADGRLLWEKRYNGPSGWDDEVSALAVDGSSNVVVTGTSEGDYYTAKYSGADGSLLWEKRYNGPANETDFIVGSHCLVLGSEGMVVVAGSSSGDFATVAYREVPELSISLTPAGVRLHFTGESGRAYQIERAPAITGPWNTIVTPIAPLSGLIEYVDTVPPVGTFFYRVVQP